MHSYTDDSDSRADKLKNLNNKASDLFPDENSPPLTLAPNRDFELKNHFDDFHTAPLFLTPKPSSSPCLSSDDESKKNIVSRNKYGSGREKEPRAESEPDTKSESDCVFQIDPNDFSDSKHVFDAPDILKAEEPRKLEWAMDEALNKDQSEYDAIEPKAMKFPFELDDFQKQAIVHLQKGESVFVSAHTSAGKTVIAEYAIALAISHLTRAIYTSPIKTLSNQKFRDFKKEFGDVGILTGDVSINPDASCLILTTEIFRSILYNGSEIIRDIEWVIFDEVHYINDYERGVVWEEVIIMLPETINIILLSATVPNALEFANWVGMTKRKNIFVISTFKRPVPLKHYVWDNNKIFPIYVNGKFNDRLFKQVLTDKKENPDKNERSGFYQNMSSKLFGTVNFLKKRDLMPTVVFVFSRRRCNTYAKIVSKLNLISKNESDKIRLIIQQAIKRLNGNDKYLPQITEICQYLERGVGVHHAGLLPLMKEVVEICFARGLVKLLFATETFAMGVNMPARTVIFDDYKKFDGRASKRMIKPGEFVQMSGRAGRRGLDQYGTVLLFFGNEFLLDREDIKRMLTSPPSKLESKFRVTYTMILNLLKSEETTVEDVINKSYDQFHRVKEAPINEESIKIAEEKLEKFLSGMNGEVEVEIESYIALFERLRGLLANINRSLMMSQTAAKEYSPGRIILIQHPDTMQVVPCVILRVHTDNNLDLKFTGIMFPPESWVTSELKERLNKNGNWTGNLANEANGKTIAFVVGPVLMSDIFSLTSKKINLSNTNEIIFNENIKEINSVYEKITKKLNEMKKDIVLDFLHKVVVRDIDIVSDIFDSVSICEKMTAFDFHGNYEFLDEFYAKVTQKRALETDLRNFQTRVSSQNTHLAAEYSAKVDVLTALGYITADRSVTLKGRVACEFSNVNSLVLTEAVFENLLSALDPPNIVALLSCLVMDAGDYQEPQLTPAQAAAVAALTAIAERVGQLQENLGAEESAEKFVNETVVPALAEAVYLWAQGWEFGRICETTDVQEGVVVRKIMRLDETCRDVKKAARIMGDPELFRKMETASSLIKRDIVFTASLYLV